MSCECENRAANFREALVAILLVGKVMSVKEAWEKASAELCQKCGKPYRVEA